MSKLRLLFYTIIIVGTKCKLWSGGFSQKGIAVLVCVALDGYHPLVTYHWTRDDELLTYSHIPVQYTTREGRYKCTVSLKDGQLCGACALDVTIGK